FGSITVLASSATSPPDAMMSLSPPGTFWATAAVGPTMGPVTFNFSSFNYTFDPSITYHFSLYARRGGNSGVVMQQEGTTASTQYPSTYYSNSSPPPYPCAMKSPYFIITK